jgi:hypothetical protein
MVTVRFCTVLFTNTRPKPTKFKTQTQYTHTPSQKRRAKSVLLLLLLLSTSSSFCVADAAMFVHITAATLANCCCPPRWAFVLSVRHVGGEATSLKSSDTCIRRMHFSTNENARNAASHGVHFLPSFRLFRTYTQNNWWRFSRRIQQLFLLGGWGPLPTCMLHRTPARDGLHA